MKKIFSWAAVAAMVILGASCNKESQLEAGRGPVNVKIEVACPNSISTKSFSDGKKAKKLQYAIYAHGTADTIKTGTAIFGDNLKTTVSATLVAGTTYDFIFWADAFGKGAATTPYAVDLVAQTMTVDYEAMATNEDDFDAFYCAESRDITSATTSLGFKLYRPFAQINIGTTDLTEARAAKFDVDNALYTVTVADAGEVLNLATGEIAQFNTTPVEFAAVNMVDNTVETFPVDDCAYLTMNYVLVDADKTTTTATLGIATAVTTNSVPVNNVPVQRNYRTNIYGALLTNPVDITVEIVPGFEDDYDVLKEFPNVSTVAEIVDAFDNGETNIILPAIEIEVPADIDIPAGASLSGQGADKTTIVVGPKEGESVVENGFVIKGENTTISDVTIDGTQIKSADWKAAVTIEENGCEISDAVITGGSKTTYGASVLVWKLGVGEEFHINNSTVSGAFRGVFAESQSGDIYVNNCDIDAVYPVSVDGAGNFGLYVTGGAIHGWTSFAAMTKGANFSGVTFSMGKSGNDCVAAYCNTTFTDCTFDDQFQIYAQTTGFTFTLNNCKKDGVAIDADNIKTMFSDSDVWNKCTCLVNGVQVAHD